MTCRYVINGRFLTQPVTGVQRYARELIAALDAVAPDGIFTLAVPGACETVPAYRRIAVKRVGRRAGILWEQIDLPAHIRAAGARGVHLCNAFPLLRPGIVCLHDMAVRAHPAFFRRAFVWWYRALFGAAVRRADALMTVSAFSKREILKYYPACAAERITVIPDAWQHFARVEPDERALFRFGLAKGAYCFAMSSLSPNKNLPWILRTAALAPKLEFAVAGMANERVFAAAPKEAVPKNVRFLGYVTDAEAKALMQGSLLFLYPTLYEGFGLPPLEALSCGARVAVSDTEVMREVLGDAALYVDPRTPGLPGETLSPADGQAVSRTLSKYDWALSARALLSLLLPKGECS